MISPSLDGRRALIVGAARSGAAAARLAAALGAEVWVTESGDAAGLGGDLDQIQHVAAFIEWGGHRAETFEQCDLIVVSPGVPLDMRLIQEARARGAEVIGEVELALRCIDAPLIGITGTNGKTTTAALTAHLIEAAGKRVFLGGNIGRPLSLLALGTIEGPAADAAEVAVVELSSFQLEAAPSLRARVAACLNLSEDHMDRYQDASSYAEAKANIFANQTEGDWALIPDDDDRIREFADRSPARRATFGPEGMVRCERGEVLYDVPALGRGRIDAGGFRLLGRHNLLNLAAAAAAALIMGAPADALADGIASFAPLPHRLDPVAEIDGVLFVNDSKATTPDSVRVALESFDSPVVLIAGGRDKGLDHSVLRGPARGKVKAAVLIGEAAAKMEAALSGSTRIEKAGSMEEAVRLARDIAGPGDVVLLSPACASYDMFRNYEDRGRRFADAVAALGQGRRQ